MVIRDLSLYLVLELAARACKGQLSCAGPQRHTSKAKASPSPETTSYNNTPEALNSVRNEAVVINSHFAIKSEDADRRLFRCIVADLLYLRRQASETSDLSLTLLYYLTLYMHGSDNCRAARFGICSAFFQLCNDCHRLCLQG